MSSSNYRKSLARSALGVAEVHQLLIEGGYFRAKIRTLTDFDKIAGGLAWGILNSRTAIDVAFVEHAAIRDKIRIAENICQALREMQCPHDLEPHQIQGLDCPRLVQVLEWLLKRVAAARQENADMVSRFTSLDFERRFGVPLAAVAAATAERHPDLAPERLSTTSSTVGLRLLQAPKRVLMSSASSTTQHSSILEHAASVLLEYGLKYQMKDSVLLLKSAAEGQMDEDKEMQRDVAKLQEDERREQQMFDALMQQMSAHREKKRIGTRDMTSIVRQTMSGDAERILKMKRAYEARREELQRRLDEEAEARNAVDAQRARAAEIEAEAADVEQRKAALEEELNNVTQSEITAKEKFARRLNKIQQQIESVEEVERMIRNDPERTSLLDHFEQLLQEEQQLMEKVRADESRVKQRIAEAKDEVTELAERVEAMGGAEGQALLQQELDAAKEDLARLLGELAKKDQEAMHITRKMDEFPTRAELQQYQIRLGELNEEMAWKFEATRLSYTLYNTRTEVVKCLENEASILQQLSDLFDVCFAGKNAAKKQSAERQQLLEQTSAIVGQLKASQIKQKEKLDEEWASIRAAKASYDQLLSRQKAYHQLVEDMKTCLEEHQALMEARLIADDDAAVEEEDEAADVERVE